MDDRLKRLLGDTQVALLTLLRRSEQSIASLAKGLGLTDNAVRTHVAALGRDGLVQQLGLERDTGGKPARIYALTHEGEELFPKAYAPVLEELIAQITRTDGGERTKELLRSIGMGIAASVEQPSGDNERVEAAAVALRRLGGDVVVQPTPEGWNLRGHGCPLSALTATRPEVCEVARALVEGVSGQDVQECTGHGPRPNCRFAVRRAVASN